VIRTCRYPARADRVVTLSQSLREVSGLAWYGDALLAHNDEQGRLSRIDPATGVVTPWSALEGSVKDDFEGLAIVDSTAWLMTSRAVLYRFDARTSTTPLAFTRITTGLARACEFEGLVALPDGILLLPCKTGGGGGVVIHRWNTRTGRPAEPATIQVSAAALKQAGASRFRPSAIEWEPASRHLLVVSSGPTMLLEIDPVGQVIELAKLTGHPQPEGIALARSRTLFLADEGARGAATLSRYTCAS